MNKLSRVFLIALVLQCGTVLAQQYVWRNVVIGGGGFVTGLLFHPQEKNLVYARTDVGGAYRSIDAGQQWMPMTDWIQGIDFTGIESFAIDPANPNRIYLAAGIYNWSRAAILCSDDRGRTWRQTEVPFKMGGNEAGRFNGERLAVDPNDGDILFFGSRHDGLWKSTDRGVNWSKVAGFPEIDTAEPRAAGAGTTQKPWFGPQAVGIVFVQFAQTGGSRGEATPVIYAGVSTAGTNFFRSDDAGVHWLAVSNQPVGLRPNHVVFAEDETMYLSYGKEAGPNTMTDGAVWKYVPATGVWTDITPLRSPDGNQSFGYGAVAVDRQHPSTIVVTTFAHWRPHDEIFRSTNGGLNWMPLLENSKWDHGYAPYTSRMVPHWMGSIQIDPFDSDRALFTTGYGIWGTGNLTDADSRKAVKWSFCDQGLEETVPLALISPPQGAHLVSGVGDIDGFRHENMDASPTETMSPGPRFSNTEDLAFSGREPNILVRAGTGQAEVHAARSIDGGETWQALGGEPAGADGGGGTIAVSANGKVIVWTPRRGHPNFSTNDGTNWATCTGVPQGTRVVADMVNPSRFYAVDSGIGKVLMSTNAAANFFETGAALPKDGGQRNSHVTISATPNIEGDLWVTAGGSGLYHSHDGGEHLDKIETVRDASAIGFGKPALGKAFPALYLSGKIGNTAGLFRSVDTGVTWTRINDDQHQYGAITRVTGDPRIFGRVYFATSGRGIIYGDETK